MIKANGKLFILLLFLLGAGTAWADVTVDQLLLRDEPPAGVVFEIIADDDGLDWAVPAINTHVRRLRERWPDLEIAVVSHGREQFALTRNEASTYSEVHEGIQQLVEQENVPVHVCGTHAGWYGVNPEDFPDYIDVAPSGPVQIRNYEDLGYALVVLDEQ